MGSCHESVYSDQPLRTKTSIRLLSLCQEDMEASLSDREDSLIQLNLEVVDLDQDPTPFQALSYTWGSPFRDEEISKEYDRVSNPRYVLLNGRKVEVGRNLFEFIQLWNSSPEFIHTDSLGANLSVEHLDENANSDSPEGRDLRPVIYLWVDALCINQDDLIERKEQVNLMSRIYTKATKVLVWLGIKDEDTGHAIRFVSHLKYESYGEAMHSRYIVRGAGDWWHNRTWFTRAWVIQEVALAQDIRFLCGSQNMDYWLFFQSLNSTSLDGTQGAGVPLFLAKGTGTGSYQPLHLIDIRMRTSPDSQERGIVRQNIAQPVQTWEHKLSLPVLLSMSWAFEATDPRDKIYSLLGISCADPRHHIEPDYEVDAAGLIVRVGRIFMEGSPDEPIQRWTSGDCEVFEPPEGLSFVQAGNTSNLVLPSWIASFGAVRICLRLWSLNFNSGRVELGRNMDLILPSNNPRALHLKRNSFDLPPIYLQTGQPREEALRKTLLANQIDDLLADSGDENDDLAIWDKPHAWRRSILKSKNGYIGLGSVLTKPGDEVWLIAGARTPYILRALPKGNDSEEAAQERKLIEEAYVHGIMYGEKMNEEDLEELILVEIPTLLFQFSVLSSHESGYSEIGQIPLDTHHGFPPANKHLRSTTRGVKGSAGFGRRPRPELGTINYEIVMRQI
ncbi:HET-domain-containing protein [Aspergillus sclerotiicarbonarius CBS 121057]|uniref:HET-domain-containing protein n=1 Tax=Aspergillus sclerotiicarbonarius (strain CBS 121057 / IBT 28362) TaxID=1448318 RepID=A0A319ERN0_ASPSB|nr:HET-domain-containing protein [Aspergillus sclerotiicarbonarius CBS 121057]